MKTYDAFERTLRDGLLDVAPPRTPSTIDAMLERTAATRQRPAWTFPGRWLPMQISAPMRVAAVPRLAWSLLILALIAALAIGALIVVGSHRRVPPPFGIAKPGLIAFDADGNLAVAGPDGSGRRTLLKSDGINLAPIFSNDGTRIAYWQQSPSTNLIALHVVSADGSNDTALTPDIVGQADGPPRVEWSPDSRRLAYAAPEGGAIFVVDVDGKNLRQVTDNRMNRGDPTWSPDGTRLAYFGGDGAEQGIYAIDVDGTNDVKLSRNLGDNYAFWQPNWSPDGRFVAYYDGYLPDHDIAVAAADGSGERILVSSPVGLVNLKNIDQYGDDMWPYFSNDGRQIAFKRDFGGDGKTFTVAVLDSDGNWMTDPVTLRVLDTHDLASSYMTWAPDDSYLLAETTHSTLALIDPSGRAPERTIETFPTGTGIGSGPPNAWSWQRLPLDQ